MKLYLLSLGAGILAGALYGVLNVRSPAPPVVALVGLLGILIGEQAVPFAKRFFADHPDVAARLGADSHAHLFGQLPGHGRGQADKPGGAASVVTMNTASTRQEPRHD
jgi:XapX domain-containing protein